MSGPRTEKKEYKKKLRRLPSATFGIKDLKTDIHRALKAGSGFGSKKSLRKTKNWL